MKSAYKKPRTHNGTLRTPVEFYETKTAKGLDVREKVANKLFTCFAEIYNPSIKDIEISRDKSVKASLTIKIRDPQSDYYVDNKHQVKVFDNRTKNRTWDIIDIRPDFDNRDFIVIVLGVTKNV